MMLKKTENQYNETARKILMDYWDPIGIKDDRGAQDEYDSYIPHIMKFIKSKDLEGFGKYIKYIEVDFMRVSKNTTYSDQKTKKLADQLILIK